ncbi:MAG: NUDIX hydrolase [Cyanobacteria bacterium J06638_22]
MTSIQAAIAILHHDGHFLLQLRNDIPTIRFPGLWGFFGGHIEPGESPEVAMHRELLEEIGYAPPTLLKFDTYYDESTVRHVFHAPLDVPLDVLDLQEGVDLKLVSVEDVRNGDSYSPKLQEVRSLAAPHRLILLEFWEKFGASG